MITMTIEELFEVGTNFESSVGEGTKSERSRIPKNYSRINLPQDLVSSIENIFSSTEIFSFISSR